MKIVLGVSSSVALYKALELSRLLSAEGAAVTAVMTANATRLIDPRLFDAVTGNKTVTDLFDRQTAFAHLETARAAEVLAVVPATANILAKLAHGLADDALSTTALAVTCPRLVAPAMNPAMWVKPEVVRNVSTLQELGYTVIPPAAGKVACGDKGIGRLAEIDLIAEDIIRLARRRDLWVGKSVVVTAGPTREYWDAARLLTNPSSGSMGHEIARRAARRGAAVTLVTGSSEKVIAASGVKVVRVETAAEMLEATEQVFKTADLLVAAAAVVDYRFEYHDRKKKLKKNQDNITVSLTPNPDILLELSKNKGSCLIVGFAAETDNLLEYTNDKLLKKNADIIIGNYIGSSNVGFGSGNTDAIIVQRGEKEEILGVIPKGTLAEMILDRAERLWAEK